MGIVIKEEKDKVISAIDCLSARTGSDSIFKPLLLKVNGDKIEVEEIDEQQVCFVRAWWKPKSLTADGLTEVVIDPVELHNAVDSRPPGEVVIEFNPPLCTVSSPGAGRSRVRLEGLKPVEKANAVPAFAKFTHQIDTTAEALSSLFDRSSKLFSNQDRIPRVTIEASPDQTQLKIGTAEDDGKDMEDPIPGGISVVGEKKNSSSRFGGKLLRDLAASASGPLKIYVGDGYPVGLEFGSETLSVRFFLAPQADET